jgi:hypothetical protein
MTTLRVELIPGRPGHYSAWVADGDMVCLVKSSRMPIYDAARALLAAAWAPSTLMTARHKGAAYDCWLPASIGTLAGWTIKERDTGRGVSIARVKYKPRETYPALSTQEAAE